ncbi:MAG TPA: Rrf2 family transcriptional regulator [Pyrinomonadaceae bacterium]|jgi:Rrf2 family protein|nr:Rrf2 family transcriptional regulator [Pyrinomonadaceae bacterium]
MSTSSRFAVAVHILTLMAWSDDEPLKSEQVAESVNTNPVVIRRMLCELAEANLVISQPGAMGGSRLSRKPNEITLLDVYRAVECPGVFSLHRQPASRECPVGMNIEAVLGSVFAETNSAVEQVLSGITVKDVMSRITPGNGKSRHHARADKLTAEMIADRTQSLGKRIRTGTIAKEH